MKIQRLLIGVTVANFGLLIFLLARPATARGTGTVLRGQALEIVDDQGRVRASIQIHPADPHGTNSSGKPYPETVMLRLIDPHGRPFVKLGGSEQGAGIGLLGDTDSTHVVLQAEGSESSLKMTQKDGREQVIKP